MNIWQKIYIDIPNAIYLPLIVLDVLDILSILYKTIIYKINITLEKINPYSSAIIANTESV